MPPLTLQIESPILFCKILQPKIPVITEYTEPTPVETKSAVVRLFPAVQHGARVGEADEHVRRGRGPVQPVQLVPYVVRRHGGWRYLLLVFICLGPND